MLARQKMPATTAMRRAIGRGTVLNSLPLSKYKSEAFEKFKEFRLEVENQTGTRSKRFNQIEVAMRFEMESMSSNKVWTLVDLPKGFKSIRCKWVYKRNLGADVEVITFKARLVAKGYTQRPGVDFEETYSPIAMTKSIRILLAISTYYDYEIWQIDVKMTFLNGFIEEEIYMDQPVGFISIGEEEKVCHFHRSIYRLKQAS
ncbi:UNVERIFIED_CONTAM: Retrovirus-related Pol polyprotein from transposon TNT 1-94 [Sesamum calycinum]|uniref:Retrovirus-related Pol polyprotein from transposon TNT 1-94 n=1 Tax=Sesamum calycinum TaxID=2727403 RepID=A0AAW2NXD7_9LAMI